MLDLRPDARQDLLRFVDHRRQRAAQVQRLAPPRTHCNAPSHIRFGVWPLGLALVPGITEGVGVFSVQQAVDLDHVIDVTGSAAHRVHQSRLGVHADMGFHPDVPLAAFFALVHVRVALATGVFRRARCRNQRGVRRRSGLPQQPFVAHVVDRRQDLRRLTKSKSSSQVSAPIELSASLQHAGGDAEITGLYTQSSYARVALVNARDDLSYLPNRQNGTRTRR